MTVASIISEYNPFHTGHGYQLEKIKEELKADFIISLMSGDFTERGEPALVPKEVRARAALNAGADLVLLLPAPYATGASNLFAYGAVKILSLLNVSDYLVFGAECDSIDRLIEIKEKIKDKASIDSEPIKELLRSGNTFAQSRALLFPEFEKELASPNNILAIDYLLSLDRVGSDMKPYLIKREGSGYLSDRLNDRGSFSSGLAIRDAVKRGDLKSVKPFVPDEIFEYLNKEKPVFNDDLSDMVFYALREHSDDLTEYLDVSKDLSNKINKNIDSYETLSSFEESLKSKDLTRARINRALIHILLNIKGDNDHYEDILNTLTHIRVLGLNKNTPLLKEIDKKSDLKLVTKLPDVIDSLNKETRSLFDADIFASQIYDHAAGIHIHEFKKTLAMVDRTLPR